MSFFLMGPRSICLPNLLWVLATGLLLSFGHRADAGITQMILPDNIPGTGSFPVICTFDPPLMERARLEVMWTDPYDRIVEHRWIHLNERGTTEARFLLDATRAVAVKNRLGVRLWFGDPNHASQPPHDDGEQAADFHVTPSTSTWSDFQIIIWHPQTRSANLALKRLGVTAGMVESYRGTEPGSRELAEIEPLIDVGLAWYLENIATDFYAPYHQWSEGRPANWRFQDVKRRYLANPQDPAAFARVPSLSDPDWLEKIRQRLGANVRALRRFRPLFYNLADEPGIADLTAHWDFDFSPASLSAMRDWLKRRYHDLAILNEEWGASFPDWEAVVPMTTREAVRRADQNFAAWSDFKEWMDYAFARALATASEAVHAADPSALSGIEGAQTPGWGGYDYSLLAGSIDVVEIADDAISAELLQSFNPRSIFLTTSTGGGAVSIRQIWRDLLRGMRGLILWDKTGRLVDRDGQVGDWGHEAAPHLKEFRNGLGALFSNSHRVSDPVAILYSPASMRIQWLLDRRRNGDDWSRRSASSEFEENRSRGSLNACAEAIRRARLQPRFVSAEQIERGELSRRGDKVLILPWTISLSESAAEEIRNFVAHGGTAIADGIPGIFNGHGRLAKIAGLADLFGTDPADAPTARAYGQGKVVNLPWCSARNRSQSELLPAILHNTKLEPSFQLAGTAAGSATNVESYLFKNGALTLLALLKRPAGSKPSSSDTETIELQRRRPAYVYNVREGRQLATASRHALTVDSLSPLILAIADQPLPSVKISGPSYAKPGANVTFEVSFDSPPAATREVMHIDVTDPNGKLVPYYSRNVVVETDRFFYLLPLSLNDKPGLWTIRALNVLSGGTAAATLAVEG